MNTDRVFEKESKYERVYRSLHDLYMISVIREGYETAHARELTPERSRELHEISGELMNRVKLQA